MPGPVERTRYELTVDLPPSRVIATLVDFGQNRVRIWRETSHPRVYRLHRLSEHQAEVTEGVPFAWSRERYDWSESGVVRLTQLESNVARNGIIQYEVRAAGRGSAIHCERYREFYGLRSRIVGTFMVAFGRRILRGQLLAGLRRATE